MPEESAVAEQEVVQPQTEQSQASAESESGEGEQQEPKHKGGFQKRIDRLTREKADAAREAEFWRAKALEAAPKPKAEPETSKSDAKPNINDFEDQAAYLEALADWKIDQRDSKRTSEERLKAADKQRETVKVEFGKKLSTFAANTPDFEETLAEISDLPANPALIEEIDSHEYGPQLLYFLGKNPEIAESLLGMTPTQIARAVGRLEPRFVPQESGEEKLVAPAISKAPKPPTPVGRTSKTAEKDPGDMDAHEYRIWRNKESGGAFDR